MARDLVLHRVLKTTGSCMLPTWRIASRLTISHGRYTKRSEQRQLHLSALPPPRKFENNLVGFASQILTQILTFHQKPSLSSVGTVGKEKDGLRSSAVQANNRQNDGARAAALAELPRCAGHAVFLCTCTGRMDAREGLDCCCCPTQTCTAMT